MKYIDIKDTHLYSVLEKASQKNKYHIFDNIKEIGQFLNGFLHAEANSNLNRYHQQGYWISDFAHFCTKTLITRTTDIAERSKIKRCNYINYIYSIQKNDAEGMKFFFELLNLYVSDERNYMLSFSDDSKGN